MDRSLDFYSQNCLRFLKEKLSKGRGFDPRRGYNDEFLLFCKFNGVLFLKTRQKFAKLIGNWDSKIFDVMLVKLHNHCSFSLCLTTYLWYFSFFSSQKMALHINIIFQTNKQINKHVKNTTWSFELTVVSSSWRTWSYSDIATQKIMAVTSSKQWIHFFRSDRCPPTSNSLWKVWK